MKLLKFASWISPCRARTWKEVGSTERTQAQVHVDAIANRMLPTVSAFSSVASRYTLTSTWHVHPSVLIFLFRLARAVTTGHYPTAVVTSPSLPGGVGGGAGGEAAVGLTAPASTAASKGGRVGGGVGSSSIILAQPVTAGDPQVPSALVPIVPLPKIPRPTAPLSEHSPSPECLASVSVAGFGIGGDLTEVTVTESSSNAGCLS